MDYTKEDPFKGGEQYDLILAINGSYPVHAYLHSLKKKGICVVVGGKLRQIAKTMLLKRIPLPGGKKLHLLSAKANVQDLSYLASLMAQGRLKSVIQNTCPLEKAAEAFYELSKGHGMGKTVITVVNGDE